MRESFPPLPLHVASFTCLALFATRPVRHSMLTGSFGNLKKLLPLRYALGEVFFLFSGFPSSTFSFNLSP